MPYKKNSLEWWEEETCNCGCGHGSGEAHEPSCHWLRIERLINLLKASAEFAAVPSLASIRVQGKLMKRKEVIQELEY